MRKLAKPTLLLIFALMLAPVLDDAEATGLGYAYGTGYYGLKFRGDLAEGEPLPLLTEALALHETGCAARDDERANVLVNLGANDSGRCDRDVSCARRAIPR